MRKFMVAVLLTLGGITACPALAQSNAQMVQCESCASSDQMKAVAKQRGEGQYYVFRMN